MLQQRLKRRDARIRTLEELLANVRENVAGSDEVTAILEERFSGLQLDLLLHECKAVKKCGARYNRSMKAFAKTLYFYSPKAYAYVRKFFTLPHPSTIRSWMSSVKCEPGFLTEVFSFLKSQIKENPWLQDCCLTFDSMSIRKQLVWDCSKEGYVGHVVCGNTENTELASEALVIMLVSLTKRFKCPVAYFFVNKLNSSGLSTLLTCTITQLHEIGIKIWSVTCDGAPANVQCFRKLGCDFNIISNDNVNCKFWVANVVEVYAMFDSCHMLKLARNTLADKKVISSKEGDIRWEHIVALNDIQKNIGFKFANKLTSQHIYFKNSIMKVALAAQVISSRVADALEFLKQKGEPSFVNSQPTVNFIRYIDSLFDVLNSRIPFAKGFKSPITAGNINTIQGVFSKTSDYLKTLNIQNKSILLSGRKMFVLGFIVTMKSTLEVAYKLLYKSQSPLQYVLTYKMSQDHVELFFSSIRARGGHNNNPNCLQFKNTVRQMLFTKDIAVVNGNCVAFDTTGDVLEFRSEKRTLKDVEESADCKKINTFLTHMDNINLCTYVEEILHYIGGYIVRSILKKITCEFCIDLLMETKETDTFTKFVNRGKLINASPAVARIIQHLEKSFQAVIIENSSYRHVSLHVTECARKSIMRKSTLFFFPNTHPINVEFGATSHEYNLFKVIAQSYIRIRTRHYERETNISQILRNKCSIRNKMTKLILFNNV